MGNDSSLLSAKKGTQVMSASPADAPAEAPSTPEKLTINRRPQDDSSDDDAKNPSESGSGQRKQSDSSSSAGGHVPAIRHNVMTTFQEKALYGDLYQVRRDIISALDDEDHDDGSWGPILVRLAWHASGTYDKSDGSGGCNGATMRSKPESEDPENKGLEVARAKLDALVEKYKGSVTAADIWVFASYIAIEAMGGPYIRFARGRKDEKAKSLCPAHGRLPSAEGDAKHIRAIFNRMGFEDQEIVVLIGGGHVLGRCHKEYSGFEGPWVDHPTQFSNEYFEELFENEWEEKTVEGTGKVQFRDKGSKPEDELMMLPTDMLMARDEGFLKWSKIYHKDADRFMADFAVAYKKLTELGCEGLVNVGSA